MGNCNPLQAAQAAFVLNRNILGIADIDHDALTRFGKGEGEEFDQIMAIFTAKPASKLLEPAGSKSLPAVGSFDSAEFFRDGNAAGIKFWFSESFQKNFIGKIEENVAACEIKAATILKNSRDAGIRKEIGAEREETALVHLAELLKAQPKGEDGILLTNECANIFYIRDKNGKLWAVLAHRLDDDWRVDALSVKRPGDWPAEDRVFSR